MSFSSDIKNELCRNDLSLRQKKQLVYGILYGINGSESGQIFLQTENKTIIDYFCELLAGVFKGIEIEVSQLEKKGLPFYSLKIAEQQWLSILKAEFALDNCSINPEYVDGNDVATGIFLRGVFLSCGFATDPNKEYHIELFLHNEEKCDQLCQLICEQGMMMKKSLRRGQAFIYTKESERISDFLTYIGAMQQSMEIMNVKIYKEVRNNVNRTVNCESANLDKTLVAAQKQVDDIKLIYSIKGEGFLADDLAAVAEIRLNNIDLTLRDIGEMLEPKISRSGVNHRLKRISKLADELRGN